MLRYIIPFVILITSLTGKESCCSSEGFESLFNGKDLNNWDLKIRNGDEEMAKKVFSVNNGLVHVFKDFPDGFELNTGNSYTHGLMYTKQSYSKFIFRFEYKWGSKRLNNFGAFQYDAGMYYHVYDDKIWPKGIEYQVRYDHTKDQNHTGDFWASGTRFQWYSEDGNSFKLPSQGGTAVEQKGGEHLADQNAYSHNLDDEWNTCEVIVMGNEYAIHKLNGKIVNMATELSVEEGIIGLQSETAEIFYRNIEIKEFKESIPMEHFLKAAAGCAN